MAATSCAVIAPPTLKPFADNRDWMLVEDLRYRIRESKLTVVVPSGFVTDFASVPSELWSLGLSPNDRYSKAAIVHDYLYWSQLCTKEQSDNILVIAMTESGVSYTTRLAVYMGVHYGGGPAWKANADERARKLPRIIPNEYINFPGDVTWAEYRKILVASGVQEPSDNQDSSFCKLGDTQAIPGS